MAGSTKESRCPDNPDLSTLPPILSFFFSFLLLLPRAHPLRHLLFSRRIFPYRIGVAVWVGCVWVVATLLAEKRGAPFELTRDLLYLYRRLELEKGSIENHPPPITISHFATFLRTLEGSLEPWAPRLIFVFIWRGE